VWIGRLPKAILYCIIIAAPFVGFQAYGYYSFCTPHTRPWCSLRLPLVYSFVQREYW
jgi:phosphatidylinositol glycan class V